MTPGTVLFASLIALFAINVPIAFALGIASLLALVVIGDVPLLVIIQRLFNAADSFPLLAVPFFILSGALMENGGISKRLIRFASALVGQTSGGLAIVSVMACMFFAAISGSSAATAAAVGSLMIPAMLKKGYAVNFSAAVVAASGELGVIIPPSIPLVLYGILAEQSIGDLFIAGFMPGILIGGSLIGISYFISRKRGYAGGEKINARELWASFKESILAILMPVIILGGIYGGVFTPTEAAVVAVVYGLIVGLFIYKELTWKDLPKVFADSALTTSIIMIIICTASLFGWLLTREQIPQAIASFFLQVADTPFVFLLLVNVLLLVVGMFFESAAALIILTPILVPIAQQLGIDLVHFGLVIIVNLAVGMVTPPVGVNLFVTCNLAKISIEDIAKALGPFLAILIIDILIITYVPAVSLFLPKLLGQ